MLLSRSLASLLGGAALLALAGTAGAADAEIAAGTHPVGAVPDATPTVIHATRHDVSAPMRDILRMLPPTTAQSNEQEPTEVPNILLKSSFTPSATKLQYPGIQRMPTGVPAPLVDLSFDAINATSSGCNCLPPDTNGDVSDHHYIQWVNGGWQAFDKVTGTPDPQTPTPKPGNSFWTGFGGSCETSNDGDPIALWDPRAQRWVMSQFVASSPYAQCVAVSTTSDPFGTYNRYQFTWPKFGDYPHMGIWTDESGSQSAYLLTTHEFSSAAGGTFQGAALIAMERDKMLAGDPSAAMLRFAGYDAYGVEPVNLVGQLAAPANACPSFVHYDQSNYDGYLFWDLCLNWTTPASSTISITPTHIAGTPFSPFGGPGSVPQQQSGKLLDAFGTHTMYRANARAFPADAPTRVSLVINHSVQADASQSAINWVHFNLDDHAAAPAQPTPLDKTILDQGTYAPDSHNRWMGGIAIDGSGNIGVGFSKSSATIHPQIEISGRTPDDAPGTLRDETNCTDGIANGSQTGYSRWGDYASMSVDPVDQCTFYFTTEYYATNSSGSWRTRVCSFKFEGCGDPNYALVAESPRRVEMCGATAAADPSYDLRVGVLNGFTGTVAFTANGVPTGATAQFSPATVSGAGNSTLTLVNGRSLASGEYAFSVDSSSGSLTRSIALELGISEAPATAVQLTAPANAATGTKVYPLLSWGPMSTDRIFGDGFDGTGLPPIGTTDALSYRVEVASDAGFGTIVVSKIVTGATSWTVDTPLAANTTYYWRVIPQNHCGDGQVSATFSFTTGTPGECPAGTTRTTVFQDDVEGGINGWTTDGSGGTNWTQRTPPTGTGLSTKVWGIPNNSTTSDRGLITPAIAVPAGASAVFLTYDAYHHFEDNGPGSCWDNGTLEIKSGTGSFAYLPGTRMLTDPYDGIVTAGEVNSGAGGWCHAPPSTPMHASVDLDGFEGQSVQLRWRAVSDANTTAPAPNGFFIDNVKVDVCQ
jgi:hypothetical protein